MEPTLCAFQLVLEGDDLPPAQPVLVSIVRPDGALVCEVVVAAGYRLVADADGVRAESLVERWLEGRT